jgi:hypothetical protein
MRRGTHERLKAHFRDLVDPKIAEHRGRTVKNTGDGLLGDPPVTRPPPGVTGHKDCGKGGLRRRELRFRFGVTAGSRSA